mgnify:CR=1 FL=1
MKTNLIFLFLVFASVIGSAQTLTLKVEGIENVKGYLYIGIYNSPESFMKKPVFGFREIGTSSVAPRAGSVD